MRNDHGPAMLCADCSQPFRELPGTSRDAGILRCSCREVPRVSGVTVLASITNQPADLTNATDALRRADANAALQQLLRVDPGRERGPLLRMLRRLRIPRSYQLQQARDRRSIQNLLQREASFFEALDTLKISSYAEYLYYRHANPSYHAAAGMLNLLAHWVLRRAERTGRCVRVLDLGCGVGHSSFLLQRLIGDAGEVIATDGDFTNLYLARRYVVPDMALFSLDGQQPLPFADASFDAVFSMDAIHYMPDKAAVFRQLRRVTRTDGLWCLSHLHNAARDNFAAGVPLRADEWAAFLPPQRTVMLSEDKVREAFVQRGRIALHACQHQPGKDNPEAFCALAGDLNGIDDRADLGALYARHCGPVELNPVYRLQRVGDRSKAMLHWPSSSLQRECTSQPPSLPETHTIDENWLGRPPAVPNELGRNLLQQFVLTPQPATYGARS